MKPAIDTELTSYLDRCHKVQKSLLASAAIPALDEHQVLLAAFRSLAVEHLGSMLSLCRMGQIAGAMALFRPLVETVARGEWLCFCAEVAYCEAFVSGKYDRGYVSFRTMARAVDQSLAIGPRLEPLEEVFTSMSDFTHTGHGVIVPRLGLQSATSDFYTLAQITSIVRQATTTTALHVAVGLRAAQQHAKASRIVQSVEDL